VMGKHLIEDGSSDTPSCFMQDGEMLVFSCEPKTPDVSTGRLSLKRPGF